MNPEAIDHEDATDFLIKIAIFVGFVVFAICMWLIKRERDRRKSAGQTVAPPEIPKS